MTRLTAFNAASRSRRESVVGGILTSSGRVLLGHRCPSRASLPNCWDLPGGHVETFESPQSTLERELQEELGAEVDLGARVRDFHLISDLYDLDIWVVPSWRGEVSNCAPDEHDALAWFSPDKLGQLQLADTRYVTVLSAVLYGRHSLK